MHKLIMILVCLGFTGSAMAATSIQRLERMIAQNQYLDAARDGEQLLSRNPKHTRARFLTALAYQMSAQPDKASALYQDLIKNNPQLPEPRNNLAMIFLARGDYDRASQLLVDAIKTHSSYAIAYDNLSRVYKGLASEAYRRAVSESSAAANYTHKIELTAITRLETLTAAEFKGNGPVEPTLINFANQETRLIEQVRKWARAWSDKDFATYRDFYSPQHRAKFESHEQWLANRRERIMRPGTLKIEVSNIEIRWRSENQAIIDFKQSFESARYSDRVAKRLGLSRVGSQWKITEERVLSVL